MGVGRRGFMVMTSAFVRRRKVVEKVRNLDLDKKCLQLRYVDTLQLVKLQVCRIKVFNFQMGEDTACAQSLFTSP